MNIGRWSYASANEAAITGNRRASGSLASSPLKHQRPYDCEQRTAIANANARPLRRRYSDFPDALAKKSTVANETVFATYRPEMSPGLRASW
jgi:hypothetical protein